MKILKNIFLFSITFLGFIKFLCAKESHFIQSRDDFFPRCFVTKNNFHNLPAPSKFHTNNNLLKKSNKNIFAIGQRMIFEGYIVDENCVPVQNAVVKIWQKNNYGRYYDGFPKNKINGDAFEIQKNLNSHNQFFTGTGSVTTDNLGYFHFISLVPCLDSKMNSRCIPEIEISVLPQQSLYNGFEGRVLIPELDRISKRKIMILNNYDYSEEYIADLKEINNNYFRYRYDIVIQTKKGVKNLRKH